MVPNAALYNRNRANDAALSRRADLTSRENRTGGPMTDDERAIRELVATWMQASEAGDTATVLSLMTDDVIFQAPGREPFGKEAFAAASQGMKDIRMQGTADIRELHVLGNWAYLRNYISIAITPPGGKPMRRAGYTLTILRKEPNGKWLLARDANLVTEVKESG
jgi:uncharacterized protein (TIGR02246 family)